jgi:hypothetical protein
MLGGSLATHREGCEKWVAESNQLPFILFMEKRVTFFPIKHKE